MVISSANNLDPLVFAMYSLGWRYTS